MAEKEAPPLDPRGPATERLFALLDRNKVGINQPDIARVAGNVAATDKRFQDLSSIRGAFRARELGQITEEQFGRLLKGGVTQSITERQSVRDQVDNVGAFAAGAAAPIVGAINLAGDVTGMFAPDNALKQFGDDLIEGYDILEEERFGATLAGRIVSETALGFGASALAAVKGMNWFKAMVTQGAFGFATSPTQNFWAGERAWDSAFWAGGGIIDGLTAKSGFKLLRHRLERKTRAKNIHYIRKKKAARSKLREKLRAERRGAGPDGSPPSPTSPPTPKGTGPATPVVEDELLTGVITRGESATDYRYEALFIDGGTNGIAPVQNGIDTAQSLGRAILEEAFDSPTAPADAEQIFQRVREAQNTLVQLQAMWNQGTLGRVVNAPLQLGPIDDQARAALAVISHENLRYLARTGQIDPNVARATLGIDNPAGAMKIGIDALNEATETLSRAADPMLAQHIESLEHMVRVLDLETRAASDKALVPYLVREVSDRVNSLRRHMATNNTPLLPNGTPFKGEEEILQSVGLFHHSEMLEAARPIIDRVFARRAGVDVSDPGVRLATKSLQEAARTGNRDAFLSSLMQLDRMAENTYKGPAIPTHKLEAFQAAGGRDMAEAVSAIENIALDVAGDNPEASKALMALSRQGQFYLWRAHRTGTRLATGDAINFIEDANKLRATGNPPPRMKKFLNPDTTTRKRIKELHSDTVQRLDQWREGKQKEAISILEDGIKYFDAIDTEGDDLGVIGDAAAKHFEEILDGLTKTKDPVLNKRMENLIKPFKKELRKINGK